MHHETKEKGEGKLPWSSKRASMFQMLRNVAREHADILQKPANNPQLEHTPLVTDLSVGTEREDNKVSQQTMEIITYINHKICRMSTTA